MQGVEGVILQRTCLQSIRKELETEFGVSDYSLSYIKSEDFKSRFLHWDDSKKNSFYVTLGGRANFSNTKKFLKRIMEK